LKPHRPELIGAATVGSAVGELLQQTSHGLYCEAGGFYIDPNRAVDRAVITHAHSDHARRGSRAYLCAEPCEPLIRTRLGDVAVESVPYGRSFTINGVDWRLNSGCGPRFSVLKRHATSNELKFDASICSSAE